MTHAQKLWNETVRPFARNLTVLDLFREQVFLDPEHAALRGPGGVEWSYSELDDWSTRAAQLLRQSGVRSGDRVALVCGRSLAGVALLLAILKAGGQYVPYDPTWPRERLVSLMNDMDITSIACDADCLPLVQSIRWDVSSKPFVICPDAPSEETETDQSVIDLFDALADDEDILFSNGFNVRDGDAFTEADLQSYVDRVASIVEPLVTEQTRLADVGCGVGTLSRKISRSVASTVCIDPSYACVSRAVETLRADGRLVVGEVATADQLDSSVLGDRDLIVVASVAQFFPNLDHFIDVVASISDSMAQMGNIVLADLVEPTQAPPGLLGVPVALVAALVDLVPAVASVTISHRSAENNFLSQRYDAILHVDRRHETTAVRLPRVASFADPVETSLLRGSDPDSCAYAIFTSGTTGKPKAVEIRHSSVTNLVSWMRDTIGINSTDTLLFTTSFCFDLSVFDTLGILAIGGCVRVASEDEVGEPQALIDILVEEGITVWDSAPATLQMLLPFLPLRDDLDSAVLRRALLSGDWIPLSLPGEVRAVFPRAEIVALGGATECTVWSNSYSVGIVNPRWTSIPYGMPMDNARYLVLTDELELCDIGEEGDLFIEGECLARDYAGSSELTAVKFLPNPHALVAGSRMYRTGDRALWMPEGHLRFLGRVDDQVKVRGYRIELGEIQAAMTHVLGVRESVVVPYETTAGPDLALFFIGDECVTEDFIRRELRASLPSYMVPTRILALAQIPVTSNGKVDRASLKALVHV